MDRIAQLLELINDPEAVAALTTEEVAFLRSEGLELFAAIRAGEVEEVDAADMAELKKLGDAIKSLEYLEAVHAEEIAALDAQLAELDAEILGQNDPEPEPEIEAEVVEVVQPTVETPEVIEAEVETETAPEPELEPVTAAAPARPTLAAGARHQQARTRPRPAPAASPEAQSRIKRIVGTQLATSEDEFTGMFTDSFNDQWDVPTSNREKVKLAKVKGDFPAELTLGKPDAVSSDLELIDNIVSPLSRRSYWAGEEMQARVAAGGFCAPAQIDYSFAGVGTAARPVRDSLAPFNASRDSLQTATPVKLTDIDIAGSDAAVSIYTNAQDIVGTTVKPQQCVPCNTMRESVLYAVTKRICFGNFGQRAWPELIDEFIRVAGVAHARMGDRAMLDRIKALADEQLETDRVFGAARDLGEAMVRAAEAWRNRNRDYDVQLHAWVPQWVPSMGSVDLMRGDQIEAQYSVLQATFRSWLAGAGVNVSFYYDSPSTGVTQDFPAEVSGTLLNPWPTSVQWGLAEEGHYLALTQPDLDLGIYRDSDLVDTNSAEMFMESFEAVHKRGVLSQWITSKVCVDGSWSDGIDGSTAMACAS